MTIKFCGAEDEVVSGFRYTSTNTCYVYCFVIVSKKTIECEYQLIKCILGRICRWLRSIEKSILNLSWQTEKEFVIRHRVYRRDHRVNTLNIDCSRLNLNIRRRALRTPLAHKQTSASSLKAQRGLLTVCAYNEMKCALGKWVKPGCEHSSAAVKSQGSLMQAGHIRSGLELDTLQRPGRVGILACFHSSRLLGDQLWWYLLSPGWWWMRNPYFQLSREICTAVQCNNLDISGENQTWMAQRDKRLPVSIVPFLCRKSLSHHNKKL